MKLSDMKSCIRVNGSHHDELSLELNSIITHLKIYMTTLCALSDIDAQIIHQDVLYYIQFIQTLSEDSELGCKYRESLVIINKMALILVKMVKERLYLLNFQKPPYCESTITAKDMSLSTSKPSTNYKFKLPSDRADHGSQHVQRRRLKNEELMVMDKWFTDHIKRPYINSEELSVLKEQTGLTASQIRTWYV